MQKRKPFYIVQRAFFLMVIITLVTTFFVSGLFARYLNSDTNENTSQVAKWEINTIDKNGEAVKLKQTPQQLDEGSKGNYFFQLSSNSEVAAEISSDSKISFKFTAETFKTSTALTSWDFIVRNGTPVENPCLFNIYVYNCSVDDLGQYLVYTKGSSKLNAEDYNALSADAKSGYTEDIELPNTSPIKETLIVSTNDTLTVEKRIEDGIPYFYLTKNLDTSDNKYFFEAGGSQAYTFRAEWNISASSNIGGDYASTFNAFSVIEKSQYNTTDYTGYVSYDTKTEVAALQTGNFTAGSGTTLNSYSLGVKVDGVSQTKEFVLAYKKCDYFEYLVYTSGLGGEPFFTELDYVFNELETRSSGIYKIGYSKLSPDMLTIIKNHRTMVDTNTSDATKKNEISYDTLKKYCESLQAQEYYKFLESQDAFENSLGYLAIGLSCSIVYDLKVVQVD